MATVVPFHRLAVRADNGYLDNPHQTSLLRFRNGAVVHTWRGGLSVPLFWTTLFSDRSGLSGPVDWRSAVANLEARRSSWKTKTSEQLFRGFPIFAEWVKSVGGGEIELDLSGLDTWRTPPFLDAVGHMIDFVDDRSSERASACARRGGPPAENSSSQRPL